MGLWLGYFQNNWKRGQTSVHDIKENIGNKGKGEKFMQKIEVKDNHLGLDVYINGVPDISLIPKDLMDAYINALTERLLEILKNKD